jgi:acetyltransferase-like isoleucine patch superfamily enzyme
MQFFHRYLHKVKGLVSHAKRLLWTHPLLRIQGMQIGRGAKVGSPVCSWPHKVSIASKCIIENNVTFNHVGIWSPGYSIKLKHGVFVGTGAEFNIRCGVTVGDHSLIAAGCRLIDHDHGIQAGFLIGPQQGQEAEIIIGSDVWIGADSIVLKGVHVGDGAVIGAGSVVTGNIPKDEIWAGVPARKIGVRSAYHLF